MAKRYEDTKKDLILYFRKGTKLLSICIALPQVVTPTTQILYDRCASMEAYTHQPQLRQGVI